MARELREDTDTIEAPKMPSQKVVKTDKGDYGIVSQDVFDLATLKNFKPYIEGEELPKAEVVVNRRGISVLKKQGEPRFYFHGNEFRKVYRGLGGKKTTLFWTYKPGNKLHANIRNHFKKMGFPGA